MAAEYGRSGPVQDNANVDNIVNQSGEIDQLSSLSLDIDDLDIIKNLDMRINDSQAYWDNAKGYDLTNVRNENMRMLLGKTEETGLYRHQKPYKENQLFLGEEAVTAYVTAQIAPPVVIPAGAETRSKLFAGDLEKAIKAHGEDVVDLERIVELCVRNIRAKRVSIIKLHFDKHYGKNGEVISESVNPEHIILDKNAKLGQNPAFICHVMKKSVDELISIYPTKKQAILDKLGIQRKTPKQMTQEIAIREVWVTHYKGTEPTEGVVTYFDDLVLEKMRNPNWLYASEDKNLLQYPKKPFILGNLVNYGNHLIDDTSPVEQAIPMQMNLNRRGRQIMENADKANGMLIISTDSGLSKDDMQNMIGDPNQKLMVKTDGQSVDNLVKQIDAQVLPDYVIQDKQDSRIQIGNLLGAPTDFTGSQADDGDPTLGEVMVKKNQSSGIQDKMVRAVTRMLGEYYQYLVQMMIVWYDESHKFVIDSGDGEFDEVVIKRSLIEEGIRVKAGKPQNPDNDHSMAVVMGLLKVKGISLLDAYKTLGLDNPQQLYDNWAKQQADPMSLARNAMDGIDESEAYVAFVDIMDGKKVEPKENPTTEYIESLRKLMSNDEFLNPKDKKKRKYQNTFMEYVNKCIDSAELRLQIDTAAGAGPEALRPQTPLPALPPPQPMGQPGMPQQGMPPQGQPGMQPPMPQAPPQAQPMMPPGAPMPPPPLQSPSAIMQGPQPAPQFQPPPQMPPM